MQKIAGPVSLALMFSGAVFSQNYTIQTFAGGGVPQGVIGTSARLGSVAGVATDAAGNVYIALQSYSAVLRMDATTRVLTLVAGTGTAGFSGDNGPAASAQLNKPSGMAVDSAGNIYIADSGNNRIRKVTNGVITTVSGGGGTLGQLSNPTGVAVDTSGNLYIADSGNNVVRKVSGIITTIVATSVQLSSPEGVALDTLGNLYIADSGNNAVRKVVLSTGILSTLFAQQGSSPSGVAVDGAGDVFFTASGTSSGVFSVVGKIPAGETAIPFAGNFTIGYSGDGGLAINAALNDPVDVAVDSTGNVYIADYNNDVVRKVTSGTITTAAGGPFGYVGDNSIATSALLFNPTSAVAGPGGPVYIVDSYHNLVRKVVNGVITTVAGTGAFGYTGDGGAATSATLNTPWGAAVDAAGNLYISDTGNSVVRKVTLSSGTITTIAGNGTPGFSGDNSAATSAMLHSPTGIAFDAAGNLYIADYGNNRVRMVSVGGTITTVAGNSTATFAGDGLAATNASLSGPVDVKLDAAGNLYIADYGNSRIRMVTSAAAGGIISTIAGNGTVSFGGDNGAATSAQLSNPEGVALDAAGDLFIADTGNNVIRQVTNQIITTIAGNGTASYSGDNGPAAGAGLNAPVGIATDSTGRIFVADSLNNLIRVMNPPCSFMLTTSSIQASGAGGSFNIGVQTAAFCSWSVTGLPAWITVAGGASSVTGPANVTLIVAAAGGIPRSVNISVAGISVTVNQSATCNYAISPGGQAFTASAGSGAVTINAPTGCAWSATNTLPFVTFNGASSGSGNGGLSFTVAANPGVDRSGTFTVAGLSFDVEQQAASTSIPNLNVLGSMAHLAAQENWTTTFTLVNQSAIPAIARLSFFGDDHTSYSADPNGSGPLTLSLTLPQQTVVPGPLLAASFDRTIAANASLIATTAGPQTPPVLVGSAQLAATGAVDGFAIFHQGLTQQEAVVPMETRNASSYLLPFDNTPSGDSNLVLGVALANISAQPVIVQVVIRDDTGAQIATESLPQLAAGDHFQFVLAAQFPVTANKRGTIEFDTPAPGQISVLGLRFTPPNNALTTIPALANVGTGGGSIAHLASGGDGWQTTFVLVDTGTTAASATLSFFGDANAYSVDPNGAGPLPLPLTFPQGNIPATTAPSITQNLAAGATLLIVSGGVTPQLLLGSAQLSTTGNVSGFAIYRHNNQEAVVPLESRSFSALVLAFDNTNSTATGIAVNNVSSAALVNIPVVVRDDAGNQIATDTLAMAPNGHYQFTLAVDRYPKTAGIRGTIEFDKPANAQIGAVGIRIPPTSTYTTLPALAK